MTKIAINGFGRIGRAAFRIAEKYKDIQIVAINDLTDNKTLAHLLKYDSVYGVYDKKVSYTDKELIVNNKKIPCLAEKDPGNLPWKKLGVDVVIESTGVFNKLEDAQKHLKAGAEKVIISAPPKSDGIKTFVVGVNTSEYDPKKDQVISCASCTTNCYAPVTKILNDKFGIIQSFMVTVHAATNDQNILDLPHKDLRRARSSFDNIIPTSSGADKATAQVIPELAGRLSASSLRVPVRVGSVIYATYQLKKSATPAEVNQAIKAASQKGFKNIIQYQTDEIVSSDIVGNSHSSVFDSLLTQQIDDTIKIVAWYDNEWGYSNRLIELAQLVGKKI